MEELFVSVDNFVLADSAFSLGTASWCQNFCVSLPVSFVSGRVPRIRKEKIRKEKTNMLMYSCICIFTFLTYSLTCSFIQICL